MPAREYREVSGNTLQLQEHPPRRSPPEMFVVARTWTETVASTDVAARRAVLRELVRQIVPVRVGIGRYRAQFKLTTLGQSISEAKPLPDFEPTVRPSRYRVCKETLSTSWHCCTRLSVERRPFKRCVGSAMLYPGRWGQAANRRLKTVVSGGTLQVELFRTVLIDVVSLQACAFGEGADGGIRWSA
jgi:hypothetical protein